MASKASSCVYVLVLASHAPSGGSNVPMPRHTAFLTGEDELALSLMSRLMERQQGLEEKSCRRRRYSDEMSWRERGGPARDDGAGEGAAGGAFLGRRPGLGLTRHHSWFDEGGCGWRLLLEGAAESGDARESIVCFSASTLGVLNPD